MIYGHYLNDCLSPSQIVCHNETYYMYYVVANGRRSYDDGPAYRALCLATTNDIKDMNSGEVYSGNPVIEWQPTEYNEEGVLNATGLVKDGTFLVYYTAMSATRAGDHLVEINVRLATSPDGFSFTDRGRVLSVHNDTVWGDPSPEKGSINELFSVGAMELNGTWYLYYLVKGRAASWDLGVAWGHSPVNISHNTAPFLRLDFVPFLDLGEEIHSNCVPVPRGTNDNDIAFMPTYSGVNASGSNIFTDIRLAPLSNPTSPGSAIVTYDFGDLRHTTFWRNNDHWYMFYQTANKQEFRLRTAPV